MPGTGNAGNLSTALFAVPPALAIYFLTQDNDTLRACKKIFDTVTHTNVPNDCSIDGLSRDVDQTAERNILLVFGLATQANAIAYFVYSKCAQNINANIKTISKVINYSGSIGIVVGSAMMLNKIQKFYGDVLLQGGGTPDGKQYDYKLSPYWQGMHDLTAFGGIGLTTLGTVCTGGFELACRESRPVPAPGEVVLDEVVSHDTSAQSVISAESQLALQQVAAARRPTLTQRVAESVCGARCSIM